MRRASDGEVVDAMSALVQAWGERARVRLAVWVHPDCDARLQECFADCVRHALTAPLRAELSEQLKHAPFTIAPWSDFLRSIEIVPVAASDVHQLLLASESRRRRISDSAFYISPRTLNAMLSSSSRPITHSMGLVPRVWLHARVALTRRGCLSVTDMIARAALLDELRFTGAHAPARAYDGLLPPAAASSAAAAAAAQRSRAEHEHEHERECSVLCVGLYQRYLVSHEFGHLLGLGHPRATWRAEQASILRRLTLSATQQLSLFHPCMDQQTVNADPDLKPLPLPSLLDILLQDGRSLGTALAQVEAIYDFRIVS